MNKQEVAQIVREVAYELQRDGTSQPWDDYIVNPMAVWNAVRQLHPGVARHIERRYPGDPYQQVKVWVPRKAKI